MGGSGAELDPDDLVKQICITLSTCNSNAVAIVEAHCRLICSGTTYSISSNGLDEMDDCTVDLLLPPSVEWELSAGGNCTEYDEDDVSGEGGAGGERLRAGVGATKRIIVTMAKPKNLQRMRVGVSNK